MRVVRRTNDAWRWSEERKNAWWNDIVDVEEIYLEPIRRETELGQRVHDCLDDWKLKLPCNETLKVEAYEKNMHVHI